MTLCLYNFLLSCKVFNVVEKNFISNISILIHIHFKSRSFNVKLCKTKFSGFT